MSSTTHQTGDLTKAILAHFGGAANLVRVAAGSGMENPPNTEQVKKWAQRGNIPTPWLPRLVWLGARLKKPLKLLNHIDTTTQG